MGVRPTPRHTQVGTRAGPTRTPRSAPTAARSPPPPPPSRGAGIHHRARAPSLASPPGASALLPGFASFAFPRLPAPQQSDLRTQQRQRLPPRRETPPPAARRGRGAQRGRKPARQGGGPGRPLSGGSGRAREQRDRPGAEGRRRTPTGFEPATSDPLRDGSEWDVEVSIRSAKLRLRSGARLEPGTPQPRFPPLHPHWRGASPTGQCPRSPQSIPPGPQGPDQSLSPLPWPPEPPPLPPFGIYTFHTFVSYYPVHA